MTLSELLKNNRDLRVVVDSVVNAELATMVRLKRKQITQLSETSETSIATSSIVVDSLIKLLSRHYDWNGCTKELKRTLSQIVMHRIVDTCKQQKHKSILEVQLTDSANMAIPLERNDEQLVELAHLVDRLAVHEPEQAHAFILQTFQNTTIEQISEILGCSTRKTDLLLKNAKNWLAKKLDE